MVVINHEVGARLSLWVVGATDRTHAPLGVKHLVVLSKREPVRLPEIVVFALVSILANPLLGIAHAALLAQVRVPIGSPALTEELRNRLRLVASLAVFSVHGSKYNT